MAFNQNIEIDVLVASYGNGELVIFDRTSANLRHLVPNVFAQTLACSSDGRLLVTASARGSVRIFEFGGLEGDELYLIYSLNMHNDGPRSVVFSGDNLLFAGIYGSHCYVWEPTVQVQNNVCEGSQDVNFGQRSTSDFESKGNKESSQETDITAVCSDDTGKYAFCGKLGGIVALFHTQNGIIASEAYFTSTISVLRVGLQASHITRVKSC